MGARGHQGVTASCPTPGMSLNWRGGGAHLGGWKELQRALRGVSGDWRDLGAGALWVGRGLRTQGSFWGLFQEILEALEVLGG